MRNELAAAFRSRPDVDQSALGCVKLISISMTFTTLSKVCDDSCRDVLELLFDPERQMLWYTAAKMAANRQLPGINQRRRYQTTTRFGDGQNRRNS